MKFKISIYETKKYKASKKKVLEFSEFKDIVDVDKKYVPLLYYFRKRLNFKDEKHDILKLKRRHIEELIEVLENRKLFKYYGDKKLWFGIFVKVSKVIKINAPITYIAISSLFIFIFLSFVLFIIYYTTFFKKLKKAVHSVQLPSFEYSCKALSLRLRYRLLYKGWKPNLLRRLLFFLHSGPYSQNSCSSSVQRKQPSTRATSWILHFPSAHHLQFVSTVLECRAVTAIFTFVRQFFQWALTISFPT